MTYFNGPHDVFMLLVAISVFLMQMLPGIIVCATKETKMPKPLLLLAYAIFGSAMAYVVWVSGHKGFVKHGELTTYIMISALFIVLLMVMCDQIVKIRKCDELECEE